MDITYYNNHIISTFFPLFCLLESIESPFFMVKSWHLPLSIAIKRGVVVAELAVVDRAVRPFKPGTLNRPSLGAEV
jgi:hypothetical protein